MTNHIGRTVLDLVGGLVLGAIIAVNVAIFAGTDDGYEASLGDIFRLRPLVGTLIVLILLATPVVMVVMLRRRRARRAPF